MEGKAKPEAATISPPGYVVEPELARAIIDFALSYEAVAGERLSKPWQIQR